MLPRIFVVGTGRSGTWILYKALGSHPAVHTFPREMRFLTDPDGLLDLVDALTIRYHPVLASEALYRFERLMRVYMTNPARAPYRGFDLPAWIGAPYFQERFDQFCAELVESEYKGRAWQIEPENEGRLVYIARSMQGFQRQLQGRPFSRFKLNLPRPTLKVVKYFADRQELIHASASLVDDLFCRAAQDHGKETWSEKTPQHLLNLDFIWELFPESVVIHIKRDPRGVVHSLMKQPWAPSDVRGASLWLQQFFHRWYDVRRRIDFSRRRYFEFKLEDFAESSTTILEEVAAFCGLDNRFVDPPSVIPDRVNYWRREMSSEDIHTVNEILGPYVEQSGYEC
jgi:hypothetical protein